MKSQLVTGWTLKDHNGSGYTLAGALPLRRFHDKVVYVLTWNGVKPDQSNIVSVKRARNGWETRTK